MLLLQAKWRLHEKFHLCCTSLWWRSSDKFGLGRSVAMLNVLQCFPLVFQPFSPEFHVFGFSIGSGNVNVDHQLGKS